MDLRTLTKLVLKLAGLYLVITTIITAIGYIANPAPNTALWFAVVHALYLVFGLWLFWFPGAIINHVLRIKGEELEAAPTGSRLLQVGLALLGAYFAVSGAYACVYTLARVKLFYRFTDPFAGAPGPPYGPDDFATGVASGVQVLLGIGLWLGRRHLAKLGANGNVDR